MKALVFCFSFVGFVLKNLLIHLKSLKLRPALIAMRQLKIQSLFSGLTLHWLVKLLMVLKTNHFQWNSEPLQIFDAASKQDSPIFHPE
jgi:hypothetical protein